MDTKHGPTVAPLAADYLEAVQADVFVVTHRNGSVARPSIGEPGLTPEQLAEQRIVKAALAGRSAVDVWSQGSGLLQVVSVPIFIDPLAARGARHAHRRPAPRPVASPIASRPSPAATSCSSTAASRAARRCRPT